MKIFGLLGTALGLALLSGFPAAAAVDHHVGRSIELPLDAPIDVAAIICAATDMDIAADFVFVPASTNCDPTLAGLTGLCLVPATPSAIDSFAALTCANPRGSGPPG